MTTTWEGGVEAVVAVAPVREGGRVQEQVQEQEQEQVATEMDPPVEEQQTSGNHLKVTPLSVCQSLDCLLIGQIDHIDSWDFF